MSQIAESDLSREVTRHLEVAETFANLQGHVELPRHVARGRRDQEILLSHIRTGDRQARGCQMGEDAHQCPHFNYCPGAKACVWDNIDTSSERES